MKTFKRVSIYKATPLLLYYVTLTSVIKAQYTRPVPAPKLVEATITVSVRNCSAKYVGSQTGASFQIHRCHQPLRKPPFAGSFAICPIPPESIAPPAPTTTTSSTTTISTTTTTTTTMPTPPTVTGITNPNATTPTTTTTTTTTTTPTTTTQPTTTTPHNPYGRLPNHGNKCIGNKYFSPEYIISSRPFWNDSLLQRLMVNHEDLLRGQCEIYFRATLPENPNPDLGILGYGHEVLNSLSCNSPYSSIPTERADLVNGLDLNQTRRHLMPVKQRRTEEDKTTEVENLLDCLETWVYDVKGMLVSGTLTPLIPESIPLPENCLHCAGTIKYDVYKNGAWERLRNTWHEMRGEILPFALLGDSCTLENEAYLHGAIISSITFQDGIHPEDELDGMPWGKLDKYWPRLVNLYMADIDKDDKFTEPQCAEGDYHTKLLQGDCVFNQRLAADPHQFREKLPVTTYPCRGTHLDINTMMTRKHDDTMDMAVVGLGCAPHHFLTCDQEYNDDQIMNSTCICHPLYSVENNDTSNPIQCLPMAGVPCMFNITGDIGGILFKETGCAPLMECKTLKEVNGERRQKKTKWELFEKTFAGFGMSPIARDYMVSRAEGMCVCKKDADGKHEYIQTPFNECLKIKGTNSCWAVVSSFKGFIIWILLYLILYY